MDLNTIARYGQSDGSLDKRKERKIYALCDGVIAGQGNGPLRPVSAPLGILMFTDDSFLADSAAAVLMGINPNRIPLLNAFQLSAEQQKSICISGKNITLEDLKSDSIDIQMPDGWINYNRE